MNILQKSYNTVKNTIKFEIFKRKFNNWCEAKELEILSDINKQRDKITEVLANEDFGCAYYKYVYITQLKESLKELSEFKNFMLNKSNETDDN